jgi:hypothetical protein
MTATPSPASSSSLTKLPRIEALNQVSSPPNQLPQLHTVRGGAAQDPEDLVSRIQALSSQTPRLMARRPARSEDSDGGEPS